MDKKKIAKALDKLLKIINKYHFTVEEAVVLYGNLIYTIGLSMLGRANEPPTIEELVKIHESNPRVSTYLILTGLDIAACVEDIRKQQSVVNEVVSDETEGEDK